MSEPPPNDPPKAKPGSLDALYERERNRASQRSTTPPPPPPPSLANPTQSALDTEAVLTNAELQRYGYRANAANAGPSERPAEKAAVLSKLPEFSRTDLIVFVVNECLGVPLCIAGGENFAHQDWVGSAIGWGVGVPLCVTGVTFPFWREPVKKAVSDWLAKWWGIVVPIAVLAAFIFAVGPDIYRRSIIGLAPAASVSADDIAAAVVKALPKQQAPATADEIADAVIRKLPAFSIRSPAAAANNSMLLDDALKTELPKSKWLHFDDVRRWQIQKSMVNGIPNGAGCNVTLNYNIADGEIHKKTGEVWGEISEPLFFAGWRFTQDNNRTFFPPGIAIFAGTDKGTVPFICGTRLKELLDSLNVGPTSFRGNESNPDLIQCKNECINVSLGKLETP